MYTHIGNGMIIKNKDIIAIFDMKTIQSSRENKRIQFKIKENNLNGKSVILKEISKNNYDEYVSEIAVSTLKKRFEREV